MATKSEEVHAAAERKGPNAKRQRKLEQRKVPHEHHTRQEPGKNTTYTHPEWKLFREKRAEAHLVGGHDAAGRA